MSRISTRLPQGLVECQKELTKQINGIKGRTMKGLLVAAIEIRRDMEMKYPLIPVDLGNLRSSFFITTVKGDETPTEYRDMGGRVPSTQTEVDRTTETRSARSALVSSLQVQAGAYKTVQKLFMGFAANYAVFVHEMVGDVNWKRPGAGAKFFEAALKNNTKRIVEIVKQFATVKR